MRGLEFFVGQPVIASLGCGLPTKCLLAVELAGDQGGLLVNRAAPGWVQPESVCQRTGVGQFKGTQSERIRRAVDTNSVPCT